jgi:hypothetical protein
MKEHPMPEPPKTTRTPRTRQRARTPTTEKRKEQFLKELANRANVSDAARAAGVGRRTAYDWRAADEAFAAAWDEAVEHAVDELEREAWRRAAEGFDEPVYQKGELVGTVRRYSDHLMSVLLKAHRPEKFRERTQTELTGPGGGPLPVAVNVYLPSNGRDEVEGDGK